jgi:hypothetical protein
MEKVSVISETRMQNLVIFSAICMVSRSIILIDQGILTCDMVIEIHVLGCYRLVVVIIFCVLVVAVE